MRLICPPSRRCVTLMLGLRVVGSPPTFSMND